MLESFPKDYFGLYIIFAIFKTINEVQKMSVSGGLEDELDTYLKDVEKAEKEHEEYLRTYREMTRRQEGGAKTLKHLKYMHNQLFGEIKRVETKDGEDISEEKLLSYKQKFKEVNGKLAEMERELPASSNGLYLSIILGSNLNVSLLNPDDRYRYKQEYESFKLTVTYVILVMFSLAYLFPFRAMDALCNFLLVWYYCTLTIRESILRVNGSRIKGWWVLHHYISCILCGITLTWRDGMCYKRFRPLFLLLTFYIGAVQLMQTKYQKECLRRLHALGQRHSMDITVEGFSSWMFKGLTFLLPFLVGGYVIQGYCSYYLFHMYMDGSGCGVDWQVIAMALLFAFITSGNIITTALVVVRKYAESPVKLLTSNYGLKLNGRKSE